MARRIEGDRGNAQESEDHGKKNRSVQAVAVETPNHHREGPDKGCLFGQERKRQKHPCRKMGQNRIPEPEDINERQAKEQEQRIDSRNVEPVRLILNVAANRPVAASAARLLPVFFQTRRKISANDRRDERKDTNRKQKNPIPQSVEAAADM